MKKTNNNSIVNGKNKVVRNTKVVGSVLLMSMLLSACGGGGDSSSTPNATTPIVNVPVTPIPGNPTNPPVVTPPISTIPPIVEPPVTQPPVTNPPIITLPPVTEIPVNPPVVQPPVMQPPVVSSEKLTTMGFTSTSATSQSQVPVTFGQVFNIGALRATEKLAGKMNDGTVVPLQLDVKATHPDGSVRHAIISAILPQQSSNQSLSMDLVKTVSAQVANVITVNELLQTGFNANVKINLAGVEYSANVEDLLKSGNVKTWISGSTVTEWLVSTPLKTSSGVDHPHLSARFAIRAYKGLSTARVDVTIENTWAYEAAPQNFIYDVIVNVGGQPVYNKTALKHYTKARWRKIFWWGNEPKVHVVHDPRYLIDTKSLPNYDPSVKISAATLTDLKNRIAKTTEPMTSGLATPHMGATGGRPDIGLVPGWGVSYLLSQDKYAKEATLNTADLAGSWSAHYRDKKTDRPIALFDYPYMTILGRPGDTYNPVTKQREVFPTCGGDCSNPNDADGSHTPAFSYLPYLVTGDYYHLEELEFWAMYHSFATNPGYRSNIKGLVHPEQVRGQAWNLRTIGQAAYIVPDNDSLKAQLNIIVSNNMDWYITNYASNPDPKNTIGAILHGYAIVYNSKIGVAPWQDDFFTSAMGHLTELGFAKAKTVLDWKAKFPVSRMTDSGYCWVLGSIYSMNIRDTETSPIFTNWSDIYKKSVAPEVVATQCGSEEMAIALRKTDSNIKAGEMTGYAYSNAGYPANMQPALAYSVDSGIPNAAKAWTVFSNRTIKPTYTDGAQFAIVPRSK